MLTRWLTFTAFLAGSANPERAAADRGTVSVAPTYRVKGHPEVELTLNCGDRKNAGVVQFWHTPFGDLQTSGFHSKLDPVFMHQDGSLVISNASILHSGLYYCLLQHTEGTTLWPYELHVSQNNQKNRELREHKRRSSCSALRFRRDVGSEEKQAASDGQFAGAVVASVLLTFVVGFSAGALTRTHVLRCLGTVTTRLRSPRQQRRQTDRANHGSEVTMTTLPPMYDSHTCIEQMEQVTVSSTTSTPPIKPQRSFRNKREVEQETTGYLEGCDYMEEEKEEAEEAAGGSLEEKSKGCDEVADQEREFSGFYLLGEDGGSQTETDEEEEEDDGRESREEKKEWRQAEEVEEEAGEQEDVEVRRGSEEEAGSNKKDEMREEKEGDYREKKGREEDGEPGSSPPRPGRRSRVIRLYQYDEDGQRYCHLPDPAPDEPSPAPKLKQRSVSLTRLNAIMAAASAGPLDTRETGREERPHFHMEI